MLLLALSAQGCGDARPLTTEDTETFAQMTFSYGTLSFEAPVLVIVVDDTPDDAGAKLRSLMAERFMADFDVEFGSACDPDDPARFVPYHRYAVIVSPSRGLDAEQASPAVDPALMVNTGRRTPEAVSAWKAAVERAILGAVTEAPGAYRPLEAQAHWARLLLGRDEPANDAERAAVDLLPDSGAVVEVFLGSGARDDESPLEPESYRIGYEPTDRAVWGYPQVITPDPTFVYCGPGRTPRIDLWNFNHGFRGDPCVDHSIFHENFYDECSLSCTGARPVTDELGRASCEAFVKTDLAPCDASIGWLDPQGADGIRRPREVDYFGTTVRLCEVQQLEGAALDSCRQQWDCSDCEPGFCLTELPGVIGDCDGMQGLWPLRFPFDTLTARTARIEVTCNVEHVVDEGGGESF